MFIHICFIYLDDIASHSFCQLFYFISLIQPLVVSFLIFIQLIAIMFSVFQLTLVKLHVVIYVLILIIQSEMVSSANYLCVTTKN